MVRQTYGVGGMIHKLSEVSKDIVLGVETNIWAFTVIEDDVIIGDNCVVGSHCYIGSGTRIGNNVRIQTGAFIPRGTIIENDVFVGPHVVMTDDKYPISVNKNYQADPPVLGNYCSIGAGAVILPGVIIGAYAMVGAGAVVTHDVKKGMLVLGMPARKTHPVNNIVQ